MYTDTCATPKCGKTRLHWKQGRCTPAFCLSSDAWSLWRGWVTLSTKLCFVVFKQYFRILSYTGFWSHNRMIVFVVVPSHKHTNTQAKNKRERERTPEEIKRGRTRNIYKKTAREGEIKRVRIKIHYITEKGSEKLVCTRAWLCLHEGVSIKQPTWALLVFSLRVEPQPKKKKKKLEKRII